KSADDADGADDVSAALYRGAEGGSSTTAFISLCSRVTSASSGTSALSTFGSYVGDRSCLSEAAYMWIIRVRSRPSLVKVISRPCSRRNGAALRRRFESALVVLGQSLSRHILSFSLEIVTSSRRSSVAVPSQLGCSLDIEEICVRTVRIVRGPINATTAVATESASIAFCIVSSRLRSCASWKVPQGQRY